MEKRPLLGDEAVALGALHAGLSGAYSYPGTPATEILEFVEKECAGGPSAVSSVGRQAGGVVANGGVHHSWSANEKVAYEEALGMSYAGRRALVAFKHVGLNVAADPFMNSAVTGIDGGLVVASADDPGMHSSQNEQDSRVFANFALIPCLEPANGQEAYDMTREAYDVSERFGLPIMMRLVTRLAHSRSGVAVGEQRAPNALKPTMDPARWTLLPSNARIGYAKLAAQQPELLSWSESSRWNELHLNPDPKAGRVGVIAAGIALNYFLENYGPDDVLPPYLKVGAYPIPAALVGQLLETVDSVLVLEEAYPYIEASLRGLLDKPRGKTVHGKLDGALPRTGELNPDIVRAALGMPARARQSATDIAIARRPPSLCAGCPHIDSYSAIKVLLDAEPDTRVFSDIGCYTLSAYPPYQSAHACVDMGASISMAMGAAAAGMHPVIATIGDSTFVHSGMTPLVGAAKRNLPITVFILDNSTVGMTGGQQTMATGDDIVRIVKGLGVNPEHLHVIDPVRKNHAANVDLINREVAYPGLSVIIAVRECIQTIKKG